MFFTSVIYVIFTFHLYEIFDLIYIILIKKSGKPLSPIQLTIFANVALTWFFLIGHIRFYY